MHHVRYFLALAESSSFTRAAESCHVSQPSLTRAIRSLEIEVGGRLFLRLREGTRLSELGTIMLPHLQEVAKRINAAKSEAKTFQEADRKTLRLGVMCTIAPEPLFALISCMNREYANVDIEILDHTARQLEEHLSSNKLDVAIYCRPDHRQDQLHYHPLFREQMMIALHPGNPLASREAVRFYDLRDQRYLNRINCEYNEGLAWQRTGFFWNAVHRSDRDDWILAMVAAGVGFGFLPAMSIKHPGVVTRPLVEPEIWREVAIVTVRGRLHSAAVGALVREAVRTKWELIPSL